ncbi:MAG: hypothetical protein ACP5F3_04695, partial [Candidatus Syntrophosphaera sp.]
MPGYPKILLTVFFLVSAALCTATEWNNYTNQKFSYSIQYPSDWEIETEYENGFFQAVPRSPETMQQASFSVEVEPLGEAERNLEWLEYTQDLQEELPARLVLKGFRDIE